MFAKNKNNKNKGQVLVLVALSLVVFIGFAALAIDVGYFYHTKNQLQGAADAAALAGAAKLDGTNNLTQSDARREAWKYACENKAAGSSVYLVTNVPANCDTPPAGTALNSGNDPTRDIVVGKWSGTAFSPYSTPVNAVKVVVRREEGAAYTYTGGGVTRFFGRIFTTTQQDIRAKAIAVRGGLPAVALPLCNPTCNLTTTLLRVGQNLTRGTSFYLRTQDGTPNIGWTAFFDVANQPNISDYILGVKKAPSNICNNCIATNQGVINPAICNLRKMIQQNRNDYIVKGTTIRGWKVLIPVFDDAYLCPGGHTGCIGDPGYQPGDPFRLIKYTEIIITDAVPSGNCPQDPEPIAAGDPRIVIVGTGTGGNQNQSTIRCFGCDSEEATQLFGSTIRLVD